MSTKRTQFIITVLYIFLAIIMIIDYALVGKTDIEEVLVVNKSFEKYYNAGGNSHYSYKIRTKNYKFSVSKSFALSAKDSQEIRIKVSPLFKEINSAEIIKTKYKEVYSLRLLSGLIFPILAILILAIGYRYKKISTLVVITKVIIIANFIYLLY